MEKLEVELLTQLLDCARQLPLFLLEPDHLCLECPYLESGLSFQHHVLGQKDFFSEKKSKKLKHHTL